MTVASTTRKTVPVVGNSVANTFAFGFKVFAKADIQVNITVIATGVSSTLVLDSDYSVLLNADQDNSPGGSITYPISGTLLDNTKELQIVSNIVMTQALNLPSGGGVFNAKVIEDSLDKAIIGVQQLIELGARSLSFPAIDSNAGQIPSAVTRANQLLGFNAGGDPIAVQPANANVNVVMQPVVAAATLALARAAMGVNASALTTSLITGAYSTVAADNAKVLQCSGTFTLSLGDAATLGAGWSCNIVNAGVGTITVGRVTAGNTLAGAASNITLAPLQAATVVVNQAANGFNLTNGNNLIFDSTDPTKQIRYVASALTAGAIRTITMPDANVALPPMTLLNNSLGADIAMPSATTYYDGPSVAQGTVGTWFVSGTITVISTSVGADAQVKLWDGTTVIASAETLSTGANAPASTTLSGIITNPAGNLRLTAKNISAATGVIKFNATGNAKDSTITAIRIA